MLLGVPLVAIYLPLAWFMLVFVSQPVRLRSIPGGREAIRNELRSLGPVGTGEWIVMAVFSLTVLLWMLRPLLARAGQAWGLPPLAGLNDTSIVILAALALFMLPISPRRRIFAMDWRTAERLPWGVLILFGGGLSLAAAIGATGVDEYIGSAIARVGHVPLWLAIAMICAIIIFLSELASNTAVATALLPIVAAAAPAMGADPLALAVPAAVAASMAFMLPVGTPPNAIVFGSGRVTMSQMARAGLGLNIAGIVIISALTMIVGDRILSANP
jgi:sodium-dependent dicarboxylate transporter 2/3/5